MPVGMAGEKEACPKRVGRRTWHVSSQDPYQNHKKRRLVFWTSHHRRTYQLTTITHRTTLRTQHGKTEGIFGQAVQNLPDPQPVASPGPGRMSWHTHPCGKFIMLNVCVTVRCLSMSLWVSVCVCVCVNIVFLTFSSEVKFCWLLFLMKALCSKHTMENAYGK